MTAKGLLDELVILCGSLSAASRISKVNRATLKRIRNGNTNAPYSKTRDRLARAVLEESRKRVYSKQQATGGDIMK